MADPISATFYARVAAGIAIFAGALVMIGGWGFNIAILRNLYPGLATMKFNTALALFSCGMGLWLLTPETRDIKHLAGQLFALIAAVIGVLTMAQYAFNANFGIDELFFTDAASRVANGVPGRPSPNSALAIFLLAAALLIVDRKKYQGRRAAIWFALAAGLIAFIGLLGYVYDIRDLYKISVYSSMALHTALVLTVLVIGVLIMRPDSEPVKIITSWNAGGIMARQLLPAALFVPPLLGWIQLMGERADLYEGKFGLALYASTNVIAFTTIIWKNAHSLNIADARRRKVEEDLRRVNEDLEMRVVQRTHELEKTNANLTREVSERQHAEAKFYGLLKSAPDAIVIVDHQGRIVLASIQAEKWFGYTVEELRGQSVEILVPERLELQHRAHRAKYITAPRTRYMGVGMDLHGRRKDGSEFPVEISLSSYQTGDGIFVTSIIRDITERKRAEEALQNYAAQLELANRELESFSYSVSHDLRTPLRAIDGFSHALLDEYSAKLDAEGRDYLHRVRAAAQHMSQLIDDLLKLSRVSRVELNVQELNLTWLAEDLILELRASDPERQVECSLATDLPARGDARLLRIALENLLANAWKFTRGREVSQIELGLTSNLGKPVYFIKDNGVGFNMAYADKLFEPFQRLHEQHEFTGTGIGLATVQRIINKHGGRIWAESDPGQGATFYFTL